MYVQQHSSTTRVRNDDFLIIKKKFNSVGSGQNTDVKFNDNDFLQDWIELNSWTEVGQWVPPVLLSMWANWFSCRGIRQRIFRCGEHADWTANDDSTTVDLDQEIGNNRQIAFSPTVGSLIMRCLLGRIGPHFAGLVTVKVIG